MWNICGVECNCDVQYLDGVRCGMWCNVSRHLQCNCVMLDVVGWCRIVDMKCVERWNDHVV